MIPDDSGWPGIYAEVPPIRQPDALCPACLAERHRSSLMGEVRMSDHTATPPPWWAVICTVIGLWILVLVSISSLWWQISKGLARENVQRVEEALQDTREKVKETKDEVQTLRETVQEAISGERRP